MKAIWSVLFLAGSAFGQQVQMPADVDSQKIDAAIKKGVEFLRTAPSPAHDHAGPHSDELILWTMIHAGVPETDGKFQELVTKILGSPLERTYKVALQAMIFEELNRVKYQNRIWQCAQFIVDNQCANGQWSYGQPTEAANNVPTGSIFRDVASGGGKTRDFGGSAPAAGGERVKPKVQKRMAVKKSKDGPPTGDNSNSQYATLGLRSCHDAGINIPDATLHLAKKWWIDSQYQTGADKGAVATGTEFDAKPGGWCYCARDSHQPYAAMSAGAVGSVVILDYMLDKDWKKDICVRAGMAWLAQHFSVTENLGPTQHGGNPKNFYHYYLYALERAGLLYGTEKIGSHLWYAEGAKVLLAEQKPDGKWEGSQWSNPTWDTCFAILFLKRATRPLVATESGGGKK